MKTRPVFLIFLLSLFISKTSFADEDVDVITIISVGTINMQLDINERYSVGSGIFGGDTRKLASNPKIAATEVGVTVLDGAFYYGFNTLATGQSVARYDVESFDSSASAITLTNSQEVISRTFNSAYSGYSFKDNISLYAGLTFGSGNYGDELFIDEFGPFLGGRYAFNLSATSTISLELSLALVNTEITFTDPGFDPYTIKSTDRSISYSATWLRALDRGRSFFVKLKIIDLELNGSSAVTQTAGGAGTATINGSQILTMLSLGMGF
ncbi:hypothetical protein MNBD_GAMMA22-1264 [hydrothermal vent metagenome]|uniref:Uncharacterized protein n=1 Tax=hydrothermal vent metagenome TaxID=652676 RepID=A0A3B0ZWS7_9ZZZZ